MRGVLILIVGLCFLGEPLLGQVNSAAALMSAAMYEEEVSGDLNKAVDLYLEIIKKYPEDRPVAAKALYHLGLITEKMGKQKADDYFTQLINNYPDQKELVALAKTRLAKTGNQISGLNLKAESTFRMAMDLYKQANFTVAASEFQKVPALAPASALAAEAQLWAGQCYFNLGAYDQAMGTFKALIQLYPQSTLVPVAELMISQVKLAMEKEPGKSPVVNLDDKTILDPATGIKYTRINALGGKNDILRTSLTITDVAPNRKFLLSDNKVIPFDNSAPYELFTANSSRRNFSRLSPDGSRIAYPTDKAISVVPVSPETGRITGSVIEYPTGEYTNGGDLNWSHDGKHIVFSKTDSLRKTNLWTLSLKDSLLKQVTFSQRFVSQPVYSKSGNVILYKQTLNYLNRYIRMSSIAAGKSVILLDSALYNNRFLVSPDNQWILYDKIDTAKYLWRMTDNQELKIMFPDFVGDFISWGKDNSLVLFYKPSFETQNAIVVNSVSGGPGLSVLNQPGLYPEWWPEGGISIIGRANDENGKIILKKINLLNQKVITLENLPEGDVVSFSPDFSRIMMCKRMKPSQSTTLYVWPFSLQDFRVTGEPTLIFKGMIDYGGFYSWSPNGKQLAVCSGGELWICPVDGGSAHQLSISPQREVYPLWSPDGKNIAVFNEGNQIQVRRADDGQLLYTRDSVDSWDWSPDGKEMVLARYDSLLTIVTIPEGKARVIGNWKHFFHSTYLDKISWSPDGSRIAINGPKDEVDFMGQIYLVDLVDNRFMEITAEDARSRRNMIWSPDGKWITYHSTGPVKIRLEGTLWEADLTDFMSQLKPGVPSGYTTDFDFSAHLVPAEGVPSDGTFTDSRDGKAYHYKKIGEQTWTTENMAYLPVVNRPANTSSDEPRYYVYGLDSTSTEEARISENYKKYGVLYNWVAAKNCACPQGWHLPGDAEWMSLERTLGMDSTDLYKDRVRTSGEVGQKLKALTFNEDDHVFTGSSGFNALPGGYRSSVSPSFQGIGIFTGFWANSSEQSQIPTARFIWPSYSAIGRSPQAKTPGYSVRCVRD